MNNSSPELLSPAGSDEALRAALAAGADAVYFGGSAFSNRMRAKNFTDDALTDAIRLCHAAGAKAHITVNTRVRDREMDDALRLCGRILGGDEDARADAVIIADLGLAAEIRKRFPHAVFHASTQTSLGSVRDCRRLAELGFRRLVLPREFSREEIMGLAGSGILTDSGEPFEYEIFLHGAHCMSYSGQCLLSYFCGGRSGNRGECAQPCRLPYRVDSGDGADRSQKNKNPSSTPLSLADLCLAGRLTDVTGTGICSLKIEGRLKSAAYVWGVTRIYRRLLDEHRNAEPGEIKELAELFTRGFTDGFYTGRYRGMAGDRTDGLGAAKEAREAGRTGSLAGPYTPGRTAKELEKRISGGGDGADIPLKAVFTMKAGVPAVFELILPAAGGREELRSRSVGDVPSPAEGGSTDGKQAARNLVKLGGTGFALREEDIAFSVDPGLWMPASALNRMRRDAAEDLRAKLGTAEPERPEDPAPRPEQPFVPYVSPARREKREDPAPPLRTLEMADGTAERVLADAEMAGPEKILRLFEKFARVYIPAYRYEKFAGLARGVGNTELCAVMPAFPLPGDGWDRMRGTLRDAGCRRILAHGIGGFRPEDREDGDWTVDLSFRGNVTNAAAAEVYRESGFSVIGLSPELPCGGIRALGKAFPVSCIAYGRIPVMTTARCVLRDGNPLCRGKGGRDPAKVFDSRFSHIGCRGTLTDRKGEIFPVLGASDCSNVIFNAEPVWMADRPEDLAGAESLAFLWTVESAEEMGETVRRYEKGEKPSGPCVRIG